MSNFMPIALPACWTSTAMSTEEPAASEATIGIVWPRTPAFWKSDLARSGSNAFGFKSLLW